MDISFPSYIEEILKSYLKQIFLDQNSPAQKTASKTFSPKEISFFAKGADELSTLFTENRSDLYANYLNDKKLRSGYLFYFFPLNFARVQSLLKQISNSFFEKNKIKILDLGSGPGTASLATLDWFVKIATQKSKKVNLEVEILCLDQNYHILKDAQFFIDALQKKYKEDGINLRVIFQARTFDLRRGKPDTLLKNNQYDFIFVANFFNEWVKSVIEEKQRFIEKITSKHLDKQGHLMLIEPALQRNTRDLMLLRDALLKRKYFHVHAPCLHQKECPMLAKTDRDWCHFYFDWHEPDFLKKADKILGNKHEFLKVAYMILTIGNLHEATVTKSKTAVKEVHRAISNLMGSKGKTELVLCGPQGRWHLTRLDKNSSPKNKDFTKIRRGDLVQFPKLKEFSYEQDGQIDVLKEDEIKPA